jgi:hypothetical protein
LSKKIAANVPVKVAVINGTIHDVSAETFFDTILYIDVLEHIEDDLHEMTEACGRLTAGGNLIVIAPALQFLFSPFDREIGHWRRYSETGLNRLCPKDCVVKNSGYLDSCGLFLSLSNKILLHQPMPTLGQIMFWDKYVVPLSTLMDRIFRFRFGKTVFTIFERL